MKQVYAAITALAVLTGGAAQGAGIDVSGYASRTVLFDGPSAVFFDGSIDFLDVVSDDGSIFLSAFAPTDPTDATLEFTGTPELFIIGAEEALLTPEPAMFLFDGARDDYLVTVMAMGADFTDAAGFFDASGTVTLEALAPVPLPGAVALLAVALGGLGLVGRRRAA